MSRRAPSAEHGRLRCRTGLDQTLKEVTFTPELKIGSGFVLRAELRRDWSNEPVFDAKDGSKKEQTTLAVDALFAF